MTRDPWTPVRVVALAVAGLLILLGAALTIIAGAYAAGELLGHPFALGDNGEAVLLAIVGGIVTIVGALITRSTLTNPPQEAPNAVHADDDPEPGQ